MVESTTNAAIRKRYEGGKYLNDGAVHSTATDAPANAADTVVAADTDVHIVDADGTNTVDLSNVAEAGREILVVHNGGANTPIVTFDDVDFVATGPANLTTNGETARVANIDGTASGWVIA